MEVRQGFGNERYLASRAKRVAPTSEGTPYLISYRAYILPAYSEAVVTCVRRKRRQVNNRQQCGHAPIKDQFLK
jgi:hypothetical protein